MLSPKGDGRINEETNHEDSLSGLIILGKQFDQRKHVSFAADDRTNRSFSTRNLASRISSHDLLNYNYLWIVLAYIFSFPDNTNLRALSIRSKFSFSSSSSLRVEWQSFVTI